MILKKKKKKMSNQYEKCVIESIFIGNVVQKSQSQWTGFYS